MNQPCPLCGKSAAVAKIQMGGSSVPVFGCPCVGSKTFDGVVRVEKIARDLLAHYARSNRKVREVMVHPVDSVAAALQIGCEVSDTVRWRFATAMGYVEVIPDLNCPRGTYRIAPSQLKHGPNGSGRDGPCDANCLKCEAELQAREVAHHLEAQRRAVDERQRKYDERLAKARSIVMPLPGPVDPQLPLTQAGRTVLDLVRVGRVTADEARWFLGTPLEAPKPTDPLDVEIDGVTLRVLLAIDHGRRRGDAPGMIQRMAPAPFTPAQRAAVSAHWSAQLRAKVAASAQLERERVLVDMQDEP